VWGPEQQESFESLKRAISQPPVLGMANFAEKFILQTDASGVSLGAVLSQEYNGFRQPIAFASRTLSAQELKASCTYELECLAVLFGTEKFRKYIEHQDFILETDNQALSWLLAHPRQLGKIGRCVVKISALKFEVRHVRGTQNIVADTLSRMFEVPMAESPGQVESNLVLTDFPLAFEEIAQLQRQDSMLDSIRAQPEKGDVVKGYSLSKGIIFCRSSRRGSPKFVVPAAAIPMVFAYFHESTLGGHLGVFKTISKIRYQFIWKGMDKDIRSRVRACHTCAVSKPAQNSQWGSLSSEVAQRLMQKIFIDYVGKFPRSKTGNTAILVCVDAFSKFVWMIPVREMTSRNTIRALEEKIFASFSVPEVLVSDNAQYFISMEFRQFCFGMGIKHVTTSPYYPQPSHAERFNKNLRAALIAFHSEAHTTWDQNLTWLQLAFNMAEHEATRATPFSVMFPFRSNSPLLNRWKINELLPEKISPRMLRRKWSMVKQNLVKSHDRLAKRYNSNRKPVPFKVGDLVYYRNHPVSHAGRQVTAKLQHRWKGPFKVSKFLTPVTVRMVETTTGQFVTRAHVSLLKPGPSSQQ
jgi:transposase InsO family protein